MPSCQTIFLETVAAESDMIWAACWSGEVEVIRGSEASVRVMGGWRRGRRRELRRKELVLDHFFEFERGFGDE